MRAANLRMISSRPTLLIWLVPFDNVLMLLARPEASVVFSTLPSARGLPQGSTPTLLKVYRHHVQIRSPTATAILMDNSVYAIEVLANKAKPRDYGLRLRWGLLVCVCGGGGGHNDPSTKPGAICDRITYYSGRQPIS